MGALALSASALRWVRDDGWVRRFATLSPAGLVIGHLERGAPHTELRARCAVDDFVSGDYQDTFEEYFGPSELGAALALARRLTSAFTFR